MIAFIPISLTEINILEKGLKKKKYTQSSNKFWQQGDIWENIGGQTVWASPNNDHFIIINHSLTSPLYGTTQSINDVQSAIASQALTESAIISAISQGKPETSPVTKFSVSPNRIFEFPRQQWIKQTWLKANLINFVAERWIRQWKITLKEQKHCQFISQSPIVHITFLRKDTSDGLVVAGGEPSFVNHTSFDLILEPGIYYYELFSYNQIGVVEFFLTENCTNEIERPWMFDEDNVDAFGNTKPFPPQKINLSDPEICTISADTSHCIFDIEVITNSYVNRYIDDTFERIYNFSGIEIFFSVPRRVRQVKIAGATFMRNRFIQGSVKLMGRNDISEPWTDITVLNDYLSPPLYPDWILDHSISYDESIEFLIYKIFLGQYGRQLDFITEIELYD
ncbi:MAG: hypothetical protein QM498_07910 [Desulfobacterium sp.]